MAPVGAPEACVVGAIAAGAAVAGAAGGGVAVAAGGGSARRAHAARPVAASSTLPTCAISRLRLGSGSKSCVPVLCSRFKPANYMTVPGAWQRVRPSRASDEIVRQFRQALFEDRLHAGELLGSEQQLATSFGVSRTTMRDALRSLEATGLVEIRTGASGGVRVARGDPNRFADALAVQLKLVGLNPRDALAAQMGLEWVGAELAATNAKAADLDELASLLEDAASVANDPARRSPTLPTHSTMPSPARRITGRSRPVCGRSASSCTRCRSRTHSRRAHNAC